MTDASAQRPHIILDGIYYATAIFFFVYLFVYFWTNAGGPKQSLRDGSKPGRLTVETSLLGRRVVQRVRVRHFPPH